MNAKVRTVRPLTLGPLKGPYLIEFVNTKVSPTAQGNLSPSLSSLAHRSTPNPVNTGLRMILSESLAGVEKTITFAYSNQCSSDTNNQASITPRVQFHYSLSNL